MGINRIRDSLTIAAKSFGHRVVEVRAQKLVHYFLVKHLKLKKSIDLFKNKIKRMIPLVKYIQYTYRVMRETRQIIKIKKQEKIARIKYVEEQRIARIK